MRPSARTRRRLVELASRLPSGRSLAWEPRGLWQDEESESTAREMGAALVRDVSREPAPEGATLYTRLRALGRSGVSVDAIARTAEAALGASLACVVIEGDGAAAAAKRLRQMIVEAAQFASDEEDDADDDLEDDDDLDEEGLDEGVDEDDRDEDDEE